MSVLLLRKVKKAQEPGLFGATEVSATSYRGQRPFSVAKGPPSRFSWPNGCSALSGKARDASSSAEPRRPSTA
jgi:hypothetical protein